MTNKRYFFNRHPRRLAVLLLASMAAFGSVEAQTYTNGTIVNDSVIHKQGYIANRADGMEAFPPEFLQKGEGMKANPYSGIQVQNISEYRVTHYVKHNEWTRVFLTTNNAAGSNSQHTNYQRWYYYNGTNELPLHDNIYNSSNRAFVYNNGLVMGSGVKRIGNNNNTQAVTHNIQVRLPNGQDTLVIGADLSRYRDLAYQYPNEDNGANAGTLTEPSLTLRHYFELVDANVMARKLTAMTYGSNNWLEEQTIHFPTRRISNAYNTIRADLVPLELELWDYWFYTNGNPNNAADQNLQNITGNDYVQIEITNYNGAGIRNAAFIDAPTNANFNNAPTYRRRLIEFQYPASGVVPSGGYAEIKVYARTGTDNARRFQLAKFTLIFDDNSEVYPWMDVVGDNARPELQPRSPQGLRELVGGKDPVAHIDFDYPKGQTFVTPAGTTTYPGNTAGNLSIANNSALPLNPQKSNYAFAPFGNNVFNYCVWGEYGVGNTAHQALDINPVSRKTGEILNPNLESGFLYIDASDLPGTVASVPFTGTFCMGTKMMCSGWMSAIAASATTVPGSVILKVIGKTPGQPDKVVYAFCPGQISQQYRRYGATGLTNSTAAGSDGYCWQQFYFEFFLNDPCVSYELKIENNCASTSGGDYFLDDVWVYAQLPEVGPQLTTPLCGGDLDVIQLETNFESLLLSTGLNESTTTVAEADRQYLSFIYLDWDNFLLRFQEGLAAMGINVNGHDLQANIDSGLYDVAEYKDVYQAAFAASMMRDTTNHKVVYGNFQWSPCFADHPAFSFAQMALDNENTVYGESTAGGQRRLVFNGAMGGFAWEFYHNYALLTTLHGKTPMTATELEDINYITEFLFNVLNECSNRSILWFVPKVQIVGTIGGLAIEDLEFCEYTTQTFAMELTGYTKKEGYEDQDGEHDDGDYVVMDEVYFDWWLGVPKSAGVDSIPATVENYMQQYTTYYETVNGETVERKLYLYDAVRCFRFMNPDVTSLSDPNIRFGQNPLYQNIQPFTPRMLDYLRSLANPADGSKPQLYIHTKIVDVQINETNVVNEIYLGDTIKYVKFVAIPIEANINEAAKDFVYICAEPQPFKVRVSDHAPHMQVGFSEKHYPSNLGTLSVRISKSQFEKLVDHGDGNYKELHIPLRDINVVTPSCFGVKMADAGSDLLKVRIANSTDSLMQDYIMKNIVMDENNAWPPAVGKVDYLVGKHDNYWTQGEVERLLKIHFDKEFQVREGYSYTLRYYFIEELNAGYQFTCNGNADIIIKIVPDYQVWTGGADNTDWSNDDNWRRADYDELYAGNGTDLRHYLPNGKQGDNPTTTNFITPADRSRKQGFAPLYCTNILMMTSENFGQVATESVNPTSTTTTYKVKPASLLYDDGDEVVNGVKTGFPALRPTASPLIRYDFQAHEWVEDSIKAHGANWNLRALGDMVTELYNDNVCDSIAFQSETELVNAHLLNYNKAWVEFALPKNQWHLVSSPLQGTLSGEWYAPTWSGRQETTYYEPITFDGLPVASITSATGIYNLGYDRFAPAVYQRQWDKAKAVLYERGAVWSANDASQTENLGEGDQGDWTGQQGQEHFEWESNNADEYLNRLVYRPFGDSKINVAVRGSWSGAHNDHTVPYDNGGFSVMPINNLKDHNEESVKTIFRLPKDDQYYDIWDWGKGYGIERRVRVYIKDGRAWPDNLAQSVADAIKDRENVNANDYMPNDTNFVELNNRGRLRSDFFVTPVAGSVSTTNPTGTLPEYYEVTLKNEGQGSLGYFLASNPFISGLDMKKFFELNKDSIYAYYLVMKGSDVDPNDASLTTSYLATQPSGSTWNWTDMNFAGFDDGTGTNLQGNTIVPPRYAFFVKKKDVDGKDLNQLTLKYTTDMMVHTPRTVPSGTSTGGGSRLWMTISAQRDGNSSEARVMKSPNASNKFMPEEDLETFVVSDITSNIPVVYTLTGRLATSINRIHDFMVLPIGIESNSDEPATVTFQGVEMLGDSLMLYDAKTGEAVPLHSGFTTRMPGRTQNRFFIVQGSSLKEALAESNLQIFGEDGIIVVTSTTGQPITDVRVYDAGGRQVYVAAPGRNEHRFRLSKGIYVVKANTEDARQVKKISN